MRIEGPRGPLLLPPVWTPDNWKALNPQLQRFIYDACTDFKFFLHNVFLPFHSEVEGEPWPTKLPWHIEQLCNDLQAAIPDALVPFKKSDPSRPIMVWILPTGHFKSSTAYALSLWLIGINRSVSILSISASGETAERMVSAVKLHLTQNQRFIDIFGPARLDDTEGPWQARKFTVERPIRRQSPTMFAAGVETEIEGHRYDIAIADDVTTGRNSSTPGNRTAVKETMTKVVWQRLHPSRRILLVIGTMHHSDDYLAWLKRRAESGDSMVQLRLFPAVLRGKWPPDKKDRSKPYRLPNGTWNVEWDPELEVLWPEFWTPERLLEDWLQDPGAFALTRLHIIQAPEGQLFPLEVLQHNCRADGKVNNMGVEKPAITAWHPEWGRARNEAMTAQQGLRLKRIVLAIDPAATAPRPGKDPDYTAIELWGLTEDNLRVLLWLDRFRTGNPTAARERIAEPIRAFEPDEVVYEALSMDRYFAIDLAKEIGMPIKTRPLTKTKAEELNALAGFAGSGMMLYAWGDERSATMMSVFEDELASYPGAHDDTVTAALHAFALFKQKRGPEGGEAKILTSDDETVENGEKKTPRRPEDAPRPFNLPPRPLAVPGRFW